MSTDDFHRLEAALLAQPEDRRRQLLLALQQSLADAPPHAVLPSVDQPRPGDPPPPFDPAGPPSTEQVLEQQRAEDA